MGWEGPERVRGMESDLAGSEDLEQTLTHWVGRQSRK